MPVNAKGKEVAARDLEPEVCLASGQLSGGAGKSVDTISRNGVEIFTESGDDLPRPVDLGKPVRILVVDDNDDVRQMAVTQLTSLGYQVAEAESAAAALDVLRQDGGVDLLFTDVIMPGMNGRELASLAAIFHPDLPVLYTSAFAAAVITEDDLLKQGRLLLQKPYRRKELARMILATLTGV